MERNMIGVGDTPVEINEYPHLGEEGWSWGSVFTSAVYIAGRSGGEVGDMERRR
jgi:hypothetical protein